MRFDFEPHRRQDVTKRLEQRLCCWKSCPAFDHEQLSLVFDSILICENGVQISVIEAVKRSVKAGFELEKGDVQLYEDHKDL